MNSNIRFLPLVVKTIIIHYLTYLLIGFSAFILLDYTTQFAKPFMACWMRPVNDPLVMAGPLFQPIRGFVFALVFFPLRSVIFERKHGWLLMFWVLVALAIISTFGAAPGSIEGLIYTKIPIIDQLKGLIKVVLQAFLLSLILWYWARNGKRWLDILMGVVFFFAFSLPLLGLLVI